MFCHNCGNKLAGHSKYCDKCGTKVNENSVSQSNLNNPAYNAMSESMDSAPNIGKIVMQFIRGVPFGFVFLAFLLPLIANGIAFHDATIYDFFCSVKNIPSDIHSAEANFIRGCSIISALLFSFTIMAFAYSYVSGIGGGIFGSLAVIDLVVLLAYVMNGMKKISSINYSIGSGFAVSTIMLLTGVIMCFSSPENEKDVPTNMFFWIGVIIAVAPIIWEVSCIV